ncbi:hypothetical protein ACIA8O_16450 [Kitasatospora sp. NPDC051853]|uniref:hypothetical protein n=1 Tax=Kitasatospora sp. NPDC051853 TaxID=3364058 RepID=UPI0037BADA17
MALALAMVTTGCAGIEANPVVQKVAQSPVTPVVLQIVKGALVKLATQQGAQNPPVGVVALAGVWGVDQLEKKVAEIRKASQGKKEEESATLLLVNQVIDGVQRTSVFRITTNRKIVVAMNGKFVQEIEERKITITAEPGTDSTIVVSDAQAGQVPFITGAVALSPSNLFTKDHTRADLDGGRDEEVADGDKAADLRVEGGKYGLTAVNGARAARWTSSDDPSLAGCGSLPGDSWGTRLYEEFPGAGVAKDVWCVQTGDGRYGTLAWSGTGAMHMHVWNFRYVLWKKPGE